MWLVSDPHRRRRVLGRAPAPLDGSPARAIQNAGPDHRLRIPALVRPGSPRDATWRTSNRRWFHRRVFQTRTIARRPPTRRRYAVARQMWAAMSHGRAPQRCRARLPCGSSGGLRSAVFVTMGSGRPAHFWYSPTSRRSQVAPTALRRTRNRYRPAARRRWNSGRSSPPAESCPHREWRGQSPRRIPLV